MVRKSKHIGIKDIAQRAGVSIGTVDRVLHKRPDVSEKTRQKVESIIKDMDYVPNLMASRLASDKVYKLAVLLPGRTPDNSYWDAPLAGVTRAEEELKGMGLKVDKYYFSLQDKDTFVTQAIKLIEARPDGVVMAPVFRKESRELMDKLDQREIPFSLFDTRLENSAYLSYFGQDPWQSGFLAGKLANYALGNKGGALIVNFTNELDNRPHLLEREKGFRDYFLGDDEVAGTTVRGNKSSNILSLNISSSEENRLAEILKQEEYSGSSVIFVTSSAHKVARHYSQAQTGGTNGAVAVTGKPVIVAYDLTADNIKYLEYGTIDFLICQKPHEQGYRALMSLFEHFAKGHEPARDNLMPIEILTKENYKNSIDYNNQYHGRS